MVNTFVFHSNCADALTVYTTRTMYRVCVCVYTHETK